MRVLAFNGSPRKKWNTATLLEKALEGAASQGAETGLFHLYDLAFKGCGSCFACKMKGGMSYGKCAVVDDLSPLLQAVERADALVLGSPIYFGTASGAMRSFMERLLFPYLAYTDPYRSLFPRKIPTAFIYTMNAGPDRFEKLASQHVAVNAMFMQMTFGSSESLLCFDTCQFEDYSKVMADRFDPVKKAERRRDVFPEDCRKAFEMGARLVHP
ncbi:MAG: flavodoxin family protein [Syntrophorhabdales bacterium]|jgi:multimeric flavodoxin WrbA